jgi:hypothetical protein
LTSYQRSLYSVKRDDFLKNVFPSNLKTFKPVTPVRPQMRMFSGSPIPEGKGKFFDFLRAAEKADAEAEGAQTPAEAASELEQDPLADLNIEFEKQGGISSGVHLDIP